MPHFRKLSPAEILTATKRPLSERTQVAQAYDVLLADFVISDYGRAELLDGERRDIVRQRLHALSKRGGLVLRFRPGRGPLIFCVEARTVAAAIPVVAPAAAAVSTQRPPRPPRHPTAAERYREVLPRWRAGCARGSHQVDAGRGSGAQSNHCNDTGSHRAR